MLLTGHLSTTQGSAKAVSLPADVLAYCWVPVGCSVGRGPRVSGLQPCMRICQRKDWIRSKSPSACPSPLHGEGQKNDLGMSSMSLRSHSNAGMTRKAACHTEITFTDHELPRNGRPGETHRETSQVYAAEVPRLAQTSPRVSSSCPCCSGRGAVQSIGPRQAPIARQRRGARLSCSSAPIASFRFRVKLAQLPGLFNLLSTLNRLLRQLFIPVLFTLWQILSGILAHGKKGCERHAGHDRQAACTAKRLEQAKRRP